MKITYHGHSCFQIESETYRLIIDPFLSGNPLAKVRPEDIRVDYILLTHGHGDHIGDTVTIARKNRAGVIASFELAHWLHWQGVETIYPFGIGGTQRFDFGSVKLTPAVHGGGYVDEENQQVIYLGEAAGMVINIGGKTLYHAGDTALFSDMKLIGERHDIDLAFLPIGDFFTMGPDEAVIAAEWVQAKHVVPMHYNTFPPIQQDPEYFVRKLKEKGIHGTVMRIGESIEL